MSSSVLDEKFDSNVQMLNDEQAVQLFENLVHSTFGISGTEFLERYHKGEYKDACDNPRLLKILMMIPKSTHSRGNE